MLFYLTQYTILLYKQITGHKEIKSQQTYSLAVKQKNASQLRLNIAGNSLSQTLTFDRIIAANHRTISVVISLTQKTIPP